MLEAGKIEEIKKRAQAARDLKDLEALKRDVELLIELVRYREEKMKALEDKNRILAQQVLELNQEIENTKADFGIDQR